MKFFVSCGEVSGDMHASALVRELKNFFPEATFQGIGGDFLRNEGVDVVLDVNEMGIIGFFEALKSIPRVNQQLQLAYRYASDADFCIFVDYPGFNLRLAKKTHKLGKKNIYYILPQVWAWGRWRAKQLKENFDLLLSIIPFEKDFFKSLGIDVYFCGSPVYDRYLTEKATLTKISVPAGKKIIGILPGSREHEVKSLLPYLENIIRKLNRRRNDLFFVISQKTDFQMTPMENVLVYDGSQYSIMSISDVLIVASGTATLETALFEKPMIVIYKTSQLTYIIGKILARIRNISLVNLILGEEVVPEFVQKIDEDLIRDKILDFLENETLYFATVEKLKKLKEVLKPGAANNAARIIFEEVIRNGHAGTDPKPA